MPGIFLVALSLTCIAKLSQDVLHRRQSSSGVHFACMQKGNDQEAKLTHLSVCGEWGVLVPPPEAGC